MAVHTDGTMDVLVNGKLERRGYTANYDTPPGFMQQTREVPLHAADEEVIWTMGGDIPRIIKIRD